MIYGTRYTAHITRAFVDPIRRYLRLSGVDSPPSTRTLDPSNLARDRLHNAHDMSPLPDTSMKSIGATLSISSAQNMKLKTVVPASDMLSEYGDVSSRISELQRQNIQAHAVLDANAQQQARYAVWLRFCINHAVFGFSFWKFTFPICRRCIWLK
jgi:hypothetical protein